MVKVLDKTLEDDLLYDGIARLFVTAQNSILGMSRAIIKGRYSTVYVQFSKRMGVDGNLVPTIEFNNIGVKPRYQGHGVFKGLINYADQTYPGHAIFIELVHNERLAHHLRHDPRFINYDEYTNNYGTIDYLDHVYEGLAFSYICLREIVA